MRKKIATVIAASLLVSSVAGCSKTDESNVTADSSVPSETTEETSDPAGVNVNIYGDAVFTKEDIEAKINSGLSNDWQDYQLEAMFDQVYGFPDNVKETLKNYYGAYAWTKMADDFPVGKSRIHCGKRLLFTAVCHYAYLCLRTPGMFVFCFPGFFA